MKILLAFVSILLLNLSCAAASNVPRGAMGQSSWRGQVIGAHARFNQSCGAACSAPVGASTGEVFAPTLTQTGQVFGKVIQATEVIHGFITVSKFLDEAQKRSRVAMTLAPIPGRRRS
jgi:hypothetical protein